MMYSGDEYYADEVTSGPPREDESEELSEELENIEDEKEEEEEESSTEELDPEKDLTKLPEDDEKDDES